MTHLQRPSFNMTSPALRRLAAAFLALLVPGGIIVAVSYLLVRHRHLVFSRFWNPKTGRKEKP